MTNKIASGAGGRKGWEMETQKKINKNNDEERKI